MTPMTKVVSHFVIVLRLYVLMPKCFISRLAGDPLEYLWVPGFHLENHCF